MVSIHLIVRVHIIVTNAKRLFRYKIKRYRYTKEKFVKLPKLFKGEINTQTTQKYTKHIHKHTKHSNFCNNLS